MEGESLPIAKRCSHLALRVRGTGMHTRELGHWAMNAGGLRALPYPHLGNGTSSASAGAAKKVTQRRSERSHQVER